MNRELFEIPEHVKTRHANPNPMVRKGGAVEGFKCGTCEFLILNQNPADKKYYKCRHRGITNGAGTDHRKKWDACYLYAEKGEHPMIRAVRRAAHGN